MGAICFIADLVVKRANHCELKFYEKGCFRKAGPPDKFLDRVALDMAIRDCLVDFGGPFSAFRTVWLFRAGYRWLSSGIPPAAKIDGRVTDACHFGPERHTNNLA